MRNIKLGAKVNLPNTMKESIDEDGGYLASDYCFDKQNSFAGYVCPHGVFCDCKENREIFCERCENV